MNGQELYEIWVKATPKRSMERVWREVPPELQEEWENFAKEFRGKWLPYPTLEEWGIKVHLVQELGRVARDIKTYDLGLSLRLLRIIIKLCYALKLKRQAERTEIELKVRERA